MARQLSPLPGHIPALDGLRGLAVLIILVYHLTWPSYGSILFWPHLFGWTGVDLFFVLSGFLITGILYDSLGAQGYFRTFYGRRALRIFPLYYAFLFTYFVLLLLIDSDADTAAYKQQLPVLLTYMQNAYWSHESPLHVAHTWSLAVEEQFYLIWPAVIYYAKNRVRLMQICIVMIVAAIGFRTALVNPDLGYTLLPARMDALAIGALIALAARGSAGASRLVRAARFGIVPLAGMVIVVAALSGGGPPHQSVAQQTVGYTLWALFYGAVLVLVVAGAGAWFFSARPLRYAGRISYALYLFHPPIIMTMKIAGVQPGTWQFTAMGAAITFGLASLSWRYFEAPILRLKRQFNYQRPQPTVAAVPSAFAAQ